MSVYSLMALTSSEMRPALDSICRRIFSTSSVAAMRRNASCKVLPGNIAASFSSALIVGLGLH